uniref:CSON015300 protein n=1 Tax=Culicoides sonorensis TaxID=179676 RepID=A0A336LRX1_CULSO
MEENLTVLEEFKRESCEIYNLGFNENLKRLHHDHLPVFVTIILLNILSILMFLKKLVWILKNTPKAYITKTVFLCGIYLVCNLMTLSIVVVPRSYFFCDSVIHITFVLCAYQMFKYVDGESNLIEFHSERPKKFNFSTPPCCCLLSLCFSKISITKRRISITRILILQLTISHILLYIALNIIKINDEETFNRIFIYTIPLIVGPILIGVWGLNIMLRLFVDAASDYRLKEKYFALQLVLIFCKLQPALFESINQIFFNDFYCQQVHPPSVYVSFVISIQMFLLGIWAFKLYKCPLRI